MNQAEEEALKAFADFLTGVEAACAEAKQKIGQIANIAQAASEEALSSLSFEKQQGSRLGEYETARKDNNDPGKWTRAHAILKQAAASISRRYHGPEYAFAYWLYGEDRIYRQKLSRA